MFSFVAVLLYTSGVGVYEMNLFPLNLFGLVLADFWNLLSIVEKLIFSSTLSMSLILSLSVRVCISWL